MLLRHYQRIHHNQWSDECFVIAQISSRLQLNVPPLLAFNLRLTCRTNGLGARRYVLFSNNQLDSLLHAGRKAEGFHPSGCPASSLGVALNRPRLHSFVSLSDT